MACDVKTIFQKLIANFHRNAFKHFGNGTKLNPTASIHKKSLISIGENSFIGKWCHISVVEPAYLKIGNYVGISPYTKILAGDRKLDVVGKYFMTIAEPINLPVIIEDDTMIGMESMILKGVTIGEGAVIGARSLVVKNILPYSIAVGMPARMVKLRFKWEDIPRHMDAIHSQYDIHRLKDEYKMAGLI
ncbi:hypothetical protein D1BOALGB6SA_9559 [Olavius sp. associated proteobacterium Delta 1]|nr:hypothetical protein D1BOALGB6SA_9559 [Olavius sp. associated proteobacterium Delta 1]